MGILLPTSAGRFVWRPGSFSLIPTCCTRRSCLIIRRGSICFRTFDTLSWTSCIPIVESSEVLLSRCAWTSLVIRALAAGALTDTVERHPVSLKRDNPITSAQGYATDVEHARIFRALVREGWAENLVEAALRFCIGQISVSTLVLGFSSLSHLEQAAASVSRGSLPREALARLPALWQELASASTGGA